MFVIHLPLELSLWFAKKVGKFVVRMEWVLIVSQVDVVEYFF